jgi:stage II sporulation protein AA (anti-sigma F factor antagonist)
VVKPLAEVSFDDRGSVLVARLEGEVDLSNVDEIRGQLVDAVSHDTEFVILDLTETKYLDSTGVRLLFELAERLQGRRQQLRLVVSDGALVRRVVVLTQLDQRVPLDATVEAAVAAVQPD